MIVASPAEHNRLLGITDSLILRVQEMHLGGSTPAELVRFLAEQGLPKPGATIALRRAKVMSGSEAKAAVHFSAEYAYRREADEAFQDAALAALDSEVQEATAA